MISIRRQKETNTVRYDDDHDPRWLDRPTYVDVDHVLKSSCAINDGVRARRRERESLDEWTRHMPCFLLKTRRRRRRRKRSAGDFLETAGGPIHSDLRLRQTGCIMQNEKGWLISLLEERGRISCPVLGRQAGRQAGRP
ncbi:hypothetical protein MPTK2_1g22710 [Marchantia polymorpha subsp. ruderalis]